MAVCTRFPCLYSTSDRQDHERSKPEQHRFEGLSAPFETVVLAWATLLSRYTGDDAPVFIVNDRFIKVSIAGLEVEEAGDEFPDTENVTGVFSNTYHNAHKLGLWLLHDSSRGTASLHTNSLVPPDHLGQMEIQLQTEIARIGEAQNKDLAIHRPNEQLCLSIVNSNPKMADGPQLLHQLVGKHATSENCAIDYAGSSRIKVSYHDLHQAADTLSAQIKSALDELCPGTNQKIVPLLIPQSEKLYIAQLAILKAGAAFCPLNLDAPEERIRFILEDVRANVVLTTAEYRDRIPNQQNLKVLLVDKSSPNLPSTATHQSSITKATDLAYVMYTSGSTGTPKGVGVSHLAATQALLAHDPYIPHFRRFLQFASPTFDVSVFEIFFPLYRGSTLVTCDRSELLNDLPGSMRSLEVDAAELTPTVAGTLLQKRQNAPGLRVLLTIGEMLTSAVVEEFGGSDGRPSMLYGMYGPTEAAIHCTLQPRFRADHRVGNIGTPFDTTSAFIIKPEEPGAKDFNEVDVLPVGFVGELAVGGYQLADGYLNRPEQTRKAFLDTADYGRLYRTGDKARMLPDGTLECLGRISSGQVKLRGQRIELGEVEQIAARSPGCRNVTASVIRGSLVIFCLVDSKDVTSAAIRETCKRWLPEFMVPSDIVLLEELPRLPSGKVDRKRLEQEYNESIAVEASQTTEERTDDDHVLCDVASRIFCQQVNLKTSLPAAGLNSLIAIRIASELRNAGFDISAMQVLACDTLAHLKTLLSSRKMSDGGHAKPSSTDVFKILRDVVLEDPAIKSEVSDIADVIACTPVQAAMLAETENNRQAYCNWIELEIPERVSLRQIWNTIEAVAARNPILRSGFLRTQQASSSYAQLIWKKLALNQIQEVDQLGYQYDFSISSQEDFLRPLSIHIKPVEKGYHVLWKIHHALYDGWSWDLIEHDLDMALRSTDANERPQFRTVAEFYHSRSRGDVESSLEFWSTELSSFRPTPLPNFNGRRMPDGVARLDNCMLKTDFNSVESCAKRQNWNSQVFYQAALSYVLSKYLGMTDITTGTVTSGRTIPVSGIEDIIGPCLATLPLRLDVGQSQTVRDVLETVHQKNRALLSHCTVPLRDIKKTCGIPPGTSLFDVLLVWQETLHTGKTPELLRRKASADYLEVPLTIELEPQGNRLSACVTFQEAVIPRSQVKLLLSQADQVVARMVNFLDAPLDFLTEDLDLAVLSLQNPYPEVPKPTSSVTSYIEYHAVRHPNSFALAFASRISGTSADITTLTYSELNQKANQLAHFLVSEGVRGNDLVGICCEKSIELYIAVLAVLKAGAGYLPLTADTPLDRIRTILSDANVQLCLCDTMVTESAQGLGLCSVFTIDKIKLEAFPAANLNLPYYGTHAAYAVFTSGTTGKPKGVLVTQENLISNLEVLNEIYPVREGSRLLQQCSHAFDVSVFEIFFSWYKGMCLCAATKDVLFRDIELAIRTMEVTHLSMTPTVAALVDPDNVPSVTFLVTAGEALSERVFRNWSSRGLYQGYGPSETTNICTVCPDVGSDHLLSNIGPPFKNTSAFVIDVDCADFKLVPRGAVGELCFGGLQVFRGYINMPDVTASRIIEHPQYGRLYRSGDLGRLLPDGTIQFVGRSDTQIKLRGQRIELGEINTVLLQSEHVRDCVTILSKDEKSNNERLVSFWVPSKRDVEDFRLLDLQDDIKATVDHLFEALTSTLPAYMVPSALVPTTNIPMTTQGKVDRRILQATLNELEADYLNKVSARSDDAQGDASDWSDNEHQIADCLAKVLRIPNQDIGRYSSFVALGLDSISAISLVRELKSAGLGDTPVSAVLKNATVARLSQHLSKAVDSKSESQSRQRDPTQVFSKQIISSIHEALSKSKIEKILPCTPLQEAMLSAGLTDSAGAYANKTLFKVNADNIDMVRRAWIVMLERHDILRSCFVPTEDSTHAYAQVVLETVELPWSEVTREAKPVEQIVEDHGQESLENAAERPPFALTQITTQSASYLLLTMHHAMYDGVAIMQLLHEVEQVCRAEDLPLSVPVEPFLANLISIDLAAADQFWDTTLANFEPTSLPALLASDGLTPRTLSKQSSPTIDVQLSVRDIEASCKKLNVSLLSACQAAWAKCLAMFLADDDVCFGNVVSGRALAIEHIDRLVAPCFNTLPVRADLSQYRTNIALMKALRELNSDSIPFQFTPLRRIQSRICPDGERLFDTLFILQQGSLELDDSIWSMELDVGAMDFPMVCEVTPDRVKDTLSVTLHFSESIINGDGAAHVISAYRSALISCINFPSTHFTNLLQPAGQVQAYKQPHTVPPFGIGVQAHGDHDSSDCPQDPLVRYLPGDQSKVVSRNPNILAVGRKVIDIADIKESMIRSDPNIVDVFILRLAQKSQSTGASVAFLVVSEKGEANKELIIQTARDAVKQLTSPSVKPACYILLKELPLNSLGNVDKHMLRELATSEFKAMEKSTPSSEKPWTKDELRLRKIFSSISNVAAERIQKHTTIFQLGLDSISAVHLASMLRKEGFNISVGDVMQHPTCSELAAFLANQSGPTEASRPAFDLASFDVKHRSEITKNYGLSEEDVEAVYPCTALQSGLVADFQHTKGKSYLNFMSLSFANTLSEDELRTSWIKICDKYAMLRAGFVNTSDAKHPFAFVVHRPGGFTLPWVSLAEDESVEEWRKSAATDVIGGLHTPAWRIATVTSGKKTALHLAMHHGLYDAQSLQLILDDFQSALEGKELHPENPFDAQLGYILGSNEDESLERKQFWEEQCKAMFINRFPCMTPLREDTEKLCTASRISRLSLSELTAKCRDAGVTLQAVGQAAWGKILAAYVGEDSATFGVVLSGRSVDGAESVAFPCITTLPVSSSVTGSRKDILQSMMGYSGAVQKHQFTPLTKIQRWAGHPNEALFDTIFAYQKSLIGGNANSVFEITDEKATVDYAISMEMYDLDDHLECRLTFKTNILPAVQAEMMLRQFDALVVDLLSDVEDAGGVVERLGGDLMSITSPKDVEISTDVKLLHQFVEINAERIPDKIAFEFATDLSDGHVNSLKWSYRELNEQANKVAHLLLDRGVSPKSLVAICFDKCVEASFAILGILKAGCAFVALDPTAPIERKRFILQDSGAKLVLSISTTSESFADQLEVATIDLDETDTSEFSTKAPELGTEITPMDVSYCLYTSGTTGTPKGCLITHENVVQALMSFQRLFTGRWTERSKWLQFASFHFDVSVLELFWSWNVGIRVVSAPRDLIFEDLAHAINALQVTHIDLTPSLARLLHPDDVPTLHGGVFITGGEQLKQEILDVWGPVGCIHNGYGPTEATIGCTMFPRVPVNGKPSNIGPAFDNIGTYVLKPGTETPVLRGAVGELCVSGKLVGKGYLNRPDLTAERFPTLSFSGERVYRTGDLVRQLHDGSFEFLGRTDDQVKLRGQRLEIGEINSVMRKEVKEVADVATLVVKHPKQQKDQLVSFVVCPPQPSKRRLELGVDNAATKSIPRLRDACQSRLPGYMVPTYFIPVTTIPLSANNKADAKSLKQFYSQLTPDQLQAFSHGASGAGKDSSDEEKNVIRIVAGFLSVDLDSVSRDSNIFELGLDSISAISLSSRLKAEGFQQAQTSVVMTNPVIHRLAAALSSNGGTSSTAGSILAAKQKIAACRHRLQSECCKILGVSKADIEAIAPCTPLQQGMISKSLESDAPVYFGSFRLQLIDDLDISRLRQAWQMVFEKVQILHTKFISTHDGYVQVALRGQELAWIDSEFTSSEDAHVYINDRLVKWRNRNREHFTSPFELLSVTEPQHRILVLHIFHGLYDAISLQLLLQHVQRAYDDLAVSDFGPNFFDVLPFGPLREQKGAQDFWTNHLARAQTKRMPQLAESDNNRPIQVIERYELGGKLEHTRRALGLTPQAVIQTCWAATLQRYMQGPTAFGMVVSGRSIDHPAANHIIGPLFNTIPFYLGCAASDSWADIAHRCHEFNTKALPYQHTPLRSIMKWTKRSPQTPMFDTLFVFQVEEKNNAEEHALWRQVEGQPQADFPLAFEAELSGEHLKLTIVAQEHYVDEEKAGNILQDFQRALTAFLQDPNARLEDTFEDVRDEAVTYNGPKANGYADLNGVHEFQWTALANKIRNEIAGLTDLPSSEVDEHVSIFELGLDSIDAIKLSSRLKKKGIDLPVSMIMRNPTIPNMVDQFSRTSSPVRSPHEPSVLQADADTLRDHLKQSGFDFSDVEDVLPATPLQEAMVADMRQSNYTRYFNHDVLSLSPGIDVERLRSAWQTVIMHSPILRTGFVTVTEPEIEASFAQIIHKTPSLAWQEVQLAEDDEPASVLSRAQEMAANANEKAVPLMLTLARQGDRQYLILSIAHALYDGFSLGLLHQDIRKAYYGSYEARPDYRETLGQIFEAAGTDAMSFWKDTVSDSKGLVFPTRDAGANDAHQTIHRKEIFSDIKFSQVKDFCKSHGITPQALGQTCWASVLASYCRTLDVIYGIVLSGRDSATANEILFPTMNTVVVRSILHGTRKEMLRYMQDNILTTLQYQHTPLRKIQALADTNGSPLFDTLFIYQNRPAIEEAPGDELYHSVQGQSEVEYPVCVEMEALGDDLVWRTACQDLALGEDGTSQLLQRLDQVLRAILDDPNADALRFGEEGISVCGLESFRERCVESEDENEDSATSAANAVQDDTWSEAERTIREVLASVAKIPEDEVTKDLTIYHMGLDSISAIKVSSLLKKRGISLSVSRILKAATVARMAEAAGVSEHSPERINGVSVADAMQQYLRPIDTKAILQEHGFSADNVVQILPATAGQVYMLAVWQNSKGVLFYPDFEYQCESSTPVDKLRDAWEKLVSLEPILRTTFISTGRSDIPYIQLVVREVSPSFEEVQNPTEPFLVNDGKFSQPMVHLFARPQEDRVALTLRIHHALYDAVSLPLLMERLERLCNGFEAVDDPATSFAELIGSSINDRSMSERQTFWQNYLDGVADTSGTKHIASQADRTTLFKPNVLETSPLEAKARKKGLSVQSMFLAAYAKVYSQLFCQQATDIVLGVYLANRSSSDQDLGHLAAPTVNLVPLRVKKPQNGLLVDLASQIQEDLQQIGNAANSSVGLWEIARWTGVKIDTFVNFLRLPEADAKAEVNGVESGSRVAIRPVDESRKSVKRDKAGERGQKPKQSKIPDALINKGISEAYLPSIDVEAAISAGGLDIGVFAPSEMMDEKMASKVVKRLKDLLNEAAV